MVGWRGGRTGRGLAMLPEVAVVGDGATWIWTLADEHFGARGEIVDCFHACEHHGTLAKTLYGAGPPAAAWAARRREDLLAQGPTPVVHALRRAKAPTTEAAQVLRVERGYFTRNAERMQYPLFRLDGLPIASGAIESAADYVVQRRMKRAGMRWSPAGGQAMLTLRARLRCRRPLVLPTAA